MAIIDTVTLAIDVPDLPRHPFTNLEDLLTANQATLAVDFNIYFDPREVAAANTFSGRIEIHGGGGARRRKLFDMAWSAFRANAADFGSGEAFAIERRSNVLLSRLNEDPSFEIRFADSIPDGFLVPARIPNPDYPFPPPLGLPSFPIRDEAIDQITAVAVLVSNDFAGMTLRDSNTVSGQF